MCVSCRTRTLGRQLLPANTTSPVWNRTHFQTDPARVRQAGPAMRVAATPYLHPARPRPGASTAGVARDPTAVGRDASQITEGVIAHLSGLVGGRFALRSTSRRKSLRGRRTTCSGHHGEQPNPEFSSRGFEEG